MRLVTAFLLTLAVTTPVHAGQERYLTGLTAFSLSVGFAGETPPPGSIDSAREAAEQHLKRAGFKLAPSAFMTPLLEVVVHIDKAPDPRGVMDYTIGISLLEPAYLKRLPEEFIQTRTWRAGQSGVGDRQAVVAAVELAVQKFIDDYYKVNPRPEPKP